MPLILHTINNRICNEKEARVVLAVLIGTRESAICYTKHVTRTGFLDRKYVSSVSGAWDNSAKRPATLYA